MQPVVVDPEMVGKLVDDRDPDLLLEVARVREVLLQRQPEQRDLVGQHRGVRLPLRPGHALIDAVEPIGVLELVASGDILDDDGNLTERDIERRRDRRECVVDDALEPVGAGRLAATVTAPTAADGHGPPMLAAVQPASSVSWLDAVLAPAPDPTAEPDGFVVVVEPNDRIHFLDWGGPAGGTGPGVLLVHGLANTGWSWAPVARRIRQARRTVAMDVRGHGLSDAPTEGYDRPTLVEDAIAVADGSRLLDRGVVVAGHGFGAIVAAWTAAALGDRCAGLVLVDGGWEDLRATTGLEPDEFLRGLDEPPEVLRSMTSYLADRRGFDPATWDADQERAARAAIVELPAGRVVPASRPHAIAGSVAAMFDYRPLEILPLVTAPIVALVAADDDEGTRESALHEVQAVLVAAGRPPIRVARFPSDGHNLPRYRPAEVSAAILGVAPDATG